MDSFFVRYRNLLVLLAILMVQIVGLAVQVRRGGDGRVSLDSRDGSSVRLIRLWAESVVSPAERTIHYSKLNAIGLWQNYLDLRHVREQNRDLQQTIDRLRLEQASMLEDTRQGQRLQVLLGFQQKYIYTTVPAQAIGSSGSDQSRVFYLDKGSSSGLKPDMAVITADGIVGKVRDVLGSTSQVLMVNDQTSGAGVILETTRIRGILRGNAAGQLQIVGVMADQRIQPGEKVLTAGGDMIFPRGLPVGEVQKVVRDPDHDSFIDIVIKPYAHLDRLDEVLVITSTEPRFSPQEQQDVTASEAQKGAEVAAIKEQQKASQIMAERLPGLIDPNLPPDQQPLLDNSNPNPVAHPPQALHTDRFSPAAATEAGADANTGAKAGAPAKPLVGKQTPAAQTAPKTLVKPAGAGHGPAGSSQPGKPRTAKPERNQ